MTNELNQRNEPDQINKKNELPMPVPELSPFQLHGFVNIVINVPKVNPGQT